MQIDETDLEDMQDDALALAKGVLYLLEAAQAAAGTGVQLGEEGLGALVSEQERVVSAIAGIARPTKGLMPVVGPVAERFTRSGREPPRGSGETE